MVMCISFNGQAAFGESSQGGGRGVYKSLENALAGTVYIKTSFFKTIGGDFHVGVDAGPNVEFNVDTNGEWAPFEFMFTTGATIGNNMYFNNCGCTGLTAYVDNFELYVAPDPIITTSISSKAFDPEYKEATFTVTSSNLSDDITINAPAGITVAPTTLPAESAGEEVTITWDGKLLRLMEI